MSKGHWGSIDLVMLCWAEEGWPRVRGCTLLKQSSNFPEIMANATSIIDIDINIYNI